MNDIHTSVNGGAPVASAPMAEPGVRRLTEKEDLQQAARAVRHGMLGSLDPARIDDVVERYLRSGSVFGAVDEDGLICGAGRWFATDVRTPGGSIPAAAVSSVGVLPTHRRRGHLRRLMSDLHDDVLSEGRPIAVLIAAEWPIYGRYGYGPATQACGYDIDARAARFVRPARGHVRLVTGEELRPLVDPIFEQFFERTPGTLRRDSLTWDWICGLRPSPDDDGKEYRYAVWHDESGDPAGFVGYSVEEKFTHNRPDAIAHGALLIGASHDADVELWRHLCELDWVSRVTLGPFSIDSAVPLELADARTAPCVDVSDNVWLRVLDVPAAFLARRSAVGGQVVVEVDDPDGPAAGRWRIELAPDGADVTPTDASPDVRLSASALGAIYLGGTPAERLARVRWLSEESDGGMARLDSLLASHPLPWNPLGF